MPSTSVPSSHAPSFLTHTPSSSHLHSLALQVCSLCSILALPYSKLACLTTLRARSPVLRVLHFHHLHFRLAHYTLGSLNTPCSLARTRPCYPCSILSSSLDSPLR